MLKQIQIDNEKYRNVINHLRQEKGFAVDEPLIPDYKDKKSAGPAFTSGLGVVSNTDSYQSANIKPPHMGSVLGSEPTISAG